MIKRIDIIGNGESRINVNINCFDSYKIGCNAAYRDSEVNCLVSVDRRMVQEAIDNSFQKPIYTRRDWMQSFAYSSNVSLLPTLPYTGDLKADDPWHWGSGPHACNLAATMNPKEIHLWGFDLWGVDNRVNNLYKDTKNYDVADKNAVDPRFWIYQLAKCFEYYPNIQWIQHQKIGWEKPNSWNIKISNIP